jgi:hypothetical protein
MQEAHIKLLGDEEIQQQIKKAGTFQSPLD